MTNLRIISLTTTATLLISPAACTQDVSHTNQAQETLQPQQQQGDEEMRRAQVIDDTATPIERRINLDGAAQAIDELTTQEQQGNVESQRAQIPDSAATPDELRINLDGVLQATDDLEAGRFDPVDTDPPREALIVNGESTFDYGSAGALLKLDFESVPRIECSGTMVSCQVFLTAYHCVEDDLNASSYRVYLQTHGILDVTAISAQATTEDGEKGDMVLLRLADTVDKANPVSPNTSAMLAASNKGLIVGFGHTGRLFNDHGIKRVGTIETEPCIPDDDSKICWQYEKDKLASTCNVDSGGPLYFASSESNVVLGGVTSTADAGCGIETQSFDVNVQHFSDWFESTGVADASTLSCGGTAGAGFEPFHITSKLNENESFPINFAVPAGASRVVIALNGQEDSSMNFDLTTLLLSAGNNNLDSCTENGKSNFASCIFSNPESGAKVIGAVKRSGSGEGLFQLMISAY